MTKIILFSFATFCPILAATFYSVVSVLDATSPQSWIVSLAAQGPLGVILIWFMVRLEKILKEHTASNNRLCRAQMVLVMTFRGATDAEREQAKQIMDELDATEKEKLQQ